MARILLVTLLVLLVSVLAEDYTSRVREAQSLLRSEGPTVQVLDEFDKLVTYLQGLLDQKTLAAALYNRALVEMSLNKMSSAIGDLETVFALDPDSRPAKNTYKEIMLRRGDFDAARLVMDENLDEDLALKMETWEKTFDKFKDILKGNQKFNYDECLAAVDATLRPLTPENVSVLELHLLCNKRKAIETLGKDRAIADDTLSSILGDYSSLLKKAPQKDLNRYSEFAQYLFFTQSNFEGAWNAAKSCLRIDNENKQCGSLSKMFARLAPILKALEEYSILDGFLYPVSEESSDLSDEKYRSFLFDWKQIHNFLNKDPIKAPKRELKSVPSSVNNNFDYLLWMVNGFAEKELGNEKLFQHLKLYRDLTRIRCEAAVYSEKSADCKVYCDGAEENGQPFFPKHAARIDEELKKKNYAEAQKLLSKFGKHVGKTEAFLKRWSVIEKIQQKQRQQQQAHFQQQQQRQQQQWQRQQQQQQQQQQMQSDPSKDFYKVLDILPDADEKTIKKAYRTQTLKYHPDKYKGDDLDDKGVELKMQEINEAYEVLSDKESREAYDRGRLGHSQGPHRGGNRGFNFQGNPNVNFNFGNFGGSGFNFNNGGFKFSGNGFQQGKQRKRRRA